MRRHLFLTRDSKFIGFAKGKTARGGAKKVNKLIDLAAVVDIVTGIIIDTFSSLREDTKNRMEYMLNTAFISDLERADYEELGPEFKFDKLQTVDQDMWNYVLFMAHLRAKPSDSYSGAESEIARQIAAQDPSWFPDKKSWQKCKFEEGQEEDASDVLDDRIIEIRAEVDATKTLSSNAAGALGIKL